MDNAHKLIQKIKKRIINKKKDELDHTVEKVEKLNSISQSQVSNQEITTEKENH